MKMDIPALLLDDPESENVSGIQEVVTTEDVKNGIEEKITSSCFKDVSKDIKENSEYKEKILSLINTCNQDMFDLKTKYILLGGHLNALSPFVHDIWSWKKGRWCKNIYEVAEHCFGLCKSTTANIIAIAKKFGHMMVTLKPEYEKYNYTQLREMLPLSDEQLKLVNPEMTEQEIKAIKKVSKNVVHGRGQNTSPLINKGIEYNLILKNDTERIDFLKLYRHWGLWLELKELNLKFYKCDLNNGDFIVVTECPRFCLDTTSYYQSYTCGLNDKGSDTYNWFKCIVKKGTSSTSYGYNHVGIGDSEFLTYLKSTKARPVIYFECKNFEEYKQKLEEKEDV